MEFLCLQELHHIVHIYYWILYIWLFLLPFLNSQWNLIFQNLMKPTIYINCFNPHWNSLWIFQCYFGDAWTVAWSDPTGKLKPTACYRIHRIEKVMGMKRKTKLAISCRIHIIIFLSLLSKEFWSYSWIKHWCFYPVSWEMSPGTFTERVLWILAHGLSFYLFLFFFNQEDLYSVEHSQRWHSKSGHLHTAVHKTQHQHKRFFCSHSQLSKKSRKENAEGLFYLL